MAYDEELANRIRELLQDEPDLTERAMFGGLAFLLGGNMALAANRAGGLMVRVGPENAEELLASSPATQVEMGDRTMRGWLALGRDHVRTMRQLRTWVNRGVTFTRTLPPKRA